MVENDVIVNSAKKIIEEAEYIIALRAPRPPDPDPLIPPEPVPLKVVWDIERRIGAVMIADRDALVRCPKEWGTTGGVFPLPKVLQWQYLRDVVPFGKNPDPKRDRYFLPNGEIVFVFLPIFGVNYRKSSGKWATIGMGGANAWELVPGQPCLNGKVLLPNLQQHTQTFLQYVPSTGFVKEKEIYILVRDCITRVPEIVPKDQRDKLEFWR